MATNKNLKEGDSLETQQTWNKFASTAKKSGFRDGAVDGRNTVYQESFDEGYVHGFKNGFAIGKYKGLLRVKAEDFHNNDPHLENSRRGWCQICNNEILLQSTTNEIIHIQTKFSNNILEQLHSKYSPMINTTLKKNLL